MRPESAQSDPERVVVECCAAGTPAVVTLHDASETALRAVFASFRYERVELELNDALPITPDEGAICYVSFLYRGRPMNFTASVREVIADGGINRLAMDVPGQIVSEGLRSAFRIPGDPGIHSVAVVGDDGVAWHAELVNLSLTGMLVRFEGEGPLLLPDQVVELSVDVGAEKVRLAGVVRRVDRDGVGIFFPDAVSEHAENPIRRAVAALEREWHSRVRR